MNHLLNLCFVLFPVALMAQEGNHNLSGGYAAEGFDVVAYFGDKAQKGSSKYTAVFEGVKYKFKSQENLDTFNGNPTRYLPQYGGWCAYAMGTSGDKVSVDPETFEIRDGKLYLFYNAFFTNTLEKWTKEGPEELRAKADENWKKVLADG